MIGRLVAWVMPYAWPLVAAVFLALAAGASVQTLRLAHAQREVAEVQAAWAGDRAQAAERARAKEAEYRAKEAADEARVKAKEEAYAELQKLHAAALAGQRAALADNGELRNALAAYARGGDPASDTQAAASDRAAALGELLARALRLDAEHAAAAESNGDAVRALLEAWPKLP